jgi:hypothetical protein
MPSSASNSFHTLWGIFSSHELILVLPVSWDHSQDVTHQVQITHGFMTLVNLVMQSE